MLIPRANSANAPGVQFCFFEKGALPWHCAIHCCPFVSLPSIHLKVTHWGIGLTYAQCNNSSSREATWPLRVISPKNVFVFLLNIKSPHLPCDCFLFSPGLSDSSWGVVQQSNVDIEGVPLSSRPVCLQSEPVWDFGRSVLILGGPFLRGPCFEADIQTRLRKRTEMDPTLRACGILIPVFAACHAVHSSQLKTDFQIKVTVKSVPHWKGWLRLKKMKSE